MKLEKTLQAKYQVLLPTMSEFQKRLWAGTEAKALGRGGIALVSRATHLARNTILRGLKESRLKKPPLLERIRHSGGGRKRKTFLTPGLITALEKLVDPVTRGDPESPLRWTSKSTRHLAQELNLQGYKVSHTLVAGLLHDLEYSLQGNRKTLEGSSHPDRNAQFEHINTLVRKRLKQGLPVISVDTKKKEIVGRFRNAGQEWRPKGMPEKVDVHDFMDPKKGKAIPYGVYDMGRNLGWVSVGIDHDTSSFAVSTIGKWWSELGQACYPHARTLMIVADGGGSNGSRLHLWKWEIQKLAEKIGVDILVSHLPPGTSKWNKIEHRLFSFISQNWKGRPLLTHAAIVKLISAVKTSTGLKVRCVLDKRKYPKGIKPTAKQMASINIKLDAFHGDWNYTIQSHAK